METWIKRGGGRGGGSLSDGGRVVRGGFQIDGINSKDVTRRRGKRKRNKRTRN